MELLITVIVLTAILITHLQLRAKRIELRLYSARYPHIEGQKLFAVLISSISKALALTCSIGWKRHKGNFHTRPLF